MAIYTKITDFAAKDSLTTGNPLKRTRGAEIDVEFNNIATAINASNEKLEQTASVFDLMSAAQIEDVQNRTLGLDVSAPIQAAIDANDHVYFPPGTYRCDTQIALRANLTLIGAGVGVTRLKKVTTTYGGVLVANSASTTAQLKNITLRDFTLFDDVVALGFSEQQHLMSFHGVDNLLVDRVEIYGFRGDGIYIGEWNGTPRTRLNTNINITNCLFDGVNKDNRNGISIITGEYITIANNVFKNLTRTDMPGAVDFEPDASITSVITNVTVKGNKFFNIGGNVGAVCCAIPATVAKFHNVVIAGNTFDTCSNAMTIISSRITSEPHNISLIGNVATTISRPFLLSKNISGVSISGNTFLCFSAALLGYDTTDIIKDVVVSNNTFTLAGTGLVGGISVGGQSNNIIFSSNTFNNYYDYCIGLGINSGDVLSSIVITGNVAQTLRGASYIALKSGGTLIGSTCVYRNNIGGMNQSNCWLTDDVGYTTNGVTAVTFNSLTLPDSFSNGISLAAINGDTGVPSTGGYQGTLVTTKPLPNGETSKWTYQHYYPANNTVKVGSFYMRKRENASNAWTAWVEFAGV